MDLDILGQSNSVIRSNVVTRKFMTPWDFGQGNIPFFQEKKVALRHDVFLNSSPCIRLFQASFGYFEFISLVFSSLNSYPSEFRCDELCCVCGLP